MGYGRIMLPTRQDQIADTKTVIESGSLYLQSNEGVAITTRKVYPKPGVVDNMDQNYLPERPQVIAELQELADPSNEAPDVHVDALLKHFADAHQIKEVTCIVAKKGSLLTDHKLRPEPPLAHGNTPAPGAGPGTGQITSRYEHDHSAAYLQASGGEPWHPHVLWKEKTVIMGPIAHLDWFAALTSNIQGMNDPRVLAVNNHIMNTMLVNLQHKLGRTKCADMLTKTEVHVMQAMFMMTRQFNRLPAILYAIHERNEVQLGLHHFNAGYYHGIAVGQGYAGVGVPITPLRPTQADMINALRIDPSTHVCTGFTGGMSVNRVDEYLTGMVDLFQFKDAVATVFDQALTSEKILRDYAGLGTAQLTREDYRRYERRVVAFIKLLDIPPWTRRGTPQYMGRAIMINTPFGRRSWTFRQDHYRIYYDLIGHPTAFDTGGAPYVPPPNLPAFTMLDEFPVFGIVPACVAARADPPLLYTNLPPDKLSQELDIVDFMWDVDETNGKTYHLATARRRWDDMEERILNQEPATLRPLEWPELPHNPGATPVVGLGLYSKLVSGMPSMINIPTSMSVKFNAIPGYFEYTGDIMIPQNLNFWSYRLNNARQELDIFQKRYDEVGVIESVPWPINFSL